MKQMYKYYTACVVTWLVVIVLMFFYASYLEAENEVRDYPNERIADMDDRQLTEMMDYHGDDPRLHYFE